MLKKLLFVTLIPFCLHASSDLAYLKEEKSIIKGFLNTKQKQVLKDLYLKIDLATAMGLVHEDFSISTQMAAPKRINPDKPIVTLTYKF